MKKRFEKLFKLIIKLIILIIILIVVTVGFYNHFKPMPKNTSVISTDHFVRESSIKFLSDETFTDRNGTRHTEQEIFDHVIAMINGAKTYILLDMFLFNDFQGKSFEDTRALSSELTKALINKKRTNRSIDIVVITDPINTIYGSYHSPHLQALIDENIGVIVTDVGRLRDSNPIYSTVWRTGLWWLPTSFIKLPNPFEQNGDKVSLKSYLRLLNFKANHRKLIMADYASPEGIKMRTLITSANPHDGSSAHGNVGIIINDSIWEDVFTTEQAIANFSDAKILPPLPDYVDNKGDIPVTLLTEMEIRRVLVDAIDRTNYGDEIDMAMFYLSDRLVIRALKWASDRGVKIRLILDPNKDAFGREKDGVPNRPVAHELTKYAEKNQKGEIDIRWCDTHGEQCHSKLILIENNDRHEMILGSANLTKRNIGDYNLETNVLIASDRPIKAIQDARNYFDRMWHNRLDRFYTTGYKTYADDSLWKRVKYRIMEKTGLSSF